MFNVSFHLNDVQIIEFLSFFFWILRRTKMLMTQIKLRERCVPDMKFVSCEFNQKTVKASKLTRSPDLGHYIANHHLVDNSDVVEPVHWNGILLPSIKSFQKSKARLIFFTPVCQGQTTHCKTLFKSSRLFSPMNVFWSMSLWRLWMQVIFDVMFIMSTTALMPIIQDLHTGWQKTKREICFKPN